MFTCQFNWRASAELVPQILDLFFVERALLGLHEVDLGGFLEDLLGDLQELVQVGLDESVGELFPVRRF